MADDREQRTTSYTDKQKDLDHPPNSPLARVPDLKDKFNEKAEAAPTKQAEPLQQKDGRGYQGPKPPGMAGPQPPAAGKRQDQKDAQMTQDKVKDQANLENEKIRKANEDLKKEKQHDREQDHDHDHDKDRE